MKFTASVWNILDAPSYVAHDMSSYTPQKTQHVMKCYTGPQEIDIFFGVTQVKENGRKICNFECEVYIFVFDIRVTAQRKWPNGPHPLSSTHI
jgi:hypothetical protein